MLVSNIRGRRQADRFFLVQRRNDYGNAGHRKNDVVRRENKERRANIRRARG